MGEEGSAPGGFGVGSGSVDDAWREPSDGTSSLVDEAALAGQSFAVGVDAHHISVAFAESGFGDDDEFRGVSVDLGDVFAESACRRGGVEFGLDHDSSAMRCSPPANRSMAETSALRQLGLVTGSRLSSSLTFAVMAMPSIVPL